MPIVIEIPVVTSDGSPLYTSDGFPIVVLGSGAPVGMTQLPLLAAYDYAALKPFLNDAALLWATPPREP